MKNTLYPLIERVIPRFIRTQFPNTKNLILDFFKWLETDNNFIRHLLDFQESQEINREIEPFIDYYLSELGWKYQSSLNIEKKKLILALKNFYLSKGSVDSYKFLFRVLYGVDCEISYPREQLFITSSAEYSQDSFCLITATTFDTAAYKALLSSKNLSTRIIGKKSKQTAIINSFTQIINKGIHYLLLDIDDIRGEFIPHETVEIINDLDSISILESIIDSSYVDITNPGRYYAVDDIVSITNCDFNGLIKVSQTTAGYIENITIVNGGLGYVVGESITTISETGTGFYAIVNAVTGNGTITEIKILNPGVGFKTKPTLKIHTSLGRLATLNAVGNEVGGIKDFKYITYYFKSTGSNTISVNSVSGENAVLAINSTKCKANKNFSFKDSRGFLGTRNCIIQDSYFFQHYSYAIESPISSHHYNAVVDDLLHPVGFVRYNKFTVNDRQSSLNTPSSYYDYTKVLSFDYTENAGIKFDVYFELLLNYQNYVTMSIPQATNIDFYKFSDNFTYLSGYFDNYDLVNIETRTEFKTLDAEMTLMPV